MKPLSEKSYVDQALKNKKGITWLDDCKIPYLSKDDKEGARYGTQADIRGANLKGDKKPWGIYGKNILASSDGRFPANLLVSDDMLNNGRERKSGKMRASVQRKNREGYTGEMPENTLSETIGNSGSYSRFFDLDLWFNNQMGKLSLDIQNTFPFIAVPKAKRSERDFGLEKMEDGDRKTPMAGRGQEGLKCKKCGKWKHSGSPCKCLQPEFEKIKFNRPSVKNIHPTVKPLKLMSYLVVLGSREGDVF
jgi:site-specific DNA-methyltransferase (adenine-specific)